MTLMKKALIAAALFAASIPAHAADDYPSREVRFIVPWNAGGSNDIAARALQQILAKDGFNIVVENAPGATGAIGLTKVANAAPDGYVIGMGTSSTLAQIAQKMTPLRNDQFTHIARVSTDPLILLVPASGPATLEEFLETMRKNPGKVSIGTPGTNNLNHIFAEMTAKVAGVPYVNVPYPGGSKVVADLSGKQIQAAVLKPSESRGQIEAGYVKPIAVFDNQRLQVFPNVPTFKEKGYDVFPYGPLVQMAYVVGPANLPGPVRDKLISVFEKAILSPTFKTFSEQNGFVVDGLSGDALEKEVVSVQKTLDDVSSKVFTSK
ncbi:MULTISPECIES: tripartite tricarboxylate transporter substrate binding protein [unclassified Bordetella]|uniref:Bug family tripartite tricarboxylate transporter substrate binding protein n=1 Tax=unclassified Bordetella TaxID=2630031 RepID=UPI001320CC64|nr:MULTISPECIES: tripartite tricarboxylate transporter substrate binding protein [unclassified Bordetella]MVW71213.1 tripartite tricarboxylate transporter substrate binding protein [Bordetella sp. 15P40C-2]MVW80407.1 tripartite tricarboxylate transporter substrate binding protein [Bordetella sp. 02P26C-1]